jgi:ATP-dependent Clp protease adaptor protein ClpS
MNDSMVKDLSHLVVKETSPKLKQPNLFKVILSNDDFTPMDFVVGVLIDFFYHTRRRATEIMLQVHFEGKGVCGIYTYEIAETKIMQVNNFARNSEYPLLCSMEIA